MEERGRKYIKISYRENEKKPHKIHQRETKLRNR